MILTEEILQKGKSSNGGWSTQQLRALGIKNFFLEKGWKRRITGKDFPESDIKMFLSLRNAHLKAKNRPDAPEQNKLF